MKEPVLLKGNNFGLTIVLDDKIEFEELLTIIAKKFVEAAKFFNTKTQVVLKIEGRVLSVEETERVLETISENSSLSIAYVMEGDQVLETKFKKVIEERSIRLKESQNESQVKKRRSLLRTILSGDFEIRTESGIRCQCGSHRGCESRSHREGKRQYRRTGMCKRLCVCRSGRE